MLTSVMFDTCFHLIFSQLRVVVSDHRAACEVPRKARFLCSALAGVRNPAFRISRAGGQSQRVPDGKQRRQPTAALHGRGRQIARSRKEFNQRA
jgi:hypothetical protein